VDDFAAWLEKRGLTGQIKVQPPSAPEDDED
jgi:hypothetical protein